MTRRPTVIDSTKRSNLFATFDSESSFEEEKDKLLSQMITMPQVETKINDILVMHRKALMDEISKHQSEAAIKFEKLLEEKIGSVNLKLSKSNIDFQAQISEIDQYIKDSVSDLQFQVGDSTIKITGFFDKLNEEAKRRKRDKTDITLMCETQSQRLTIIESLIEEYSDSLQNLGEVTGTILELLNISNVLDSQDEEDRQSISLWGMYDKPSRSKAKDYSRSIEHIRKPNSKEKLKLAKIQNPNGNYNVITLDKDCYS